MSDDWKEGKPRKNQSPLFGGLFSLLLCSLITFSIFDLALPLPRELAKVRPLSAKNPADVLILSRLAHRRAQIGAEKA